MKLSQSQRLYSADRRYDYLSYDRRAAKDRYTQEERLEIHRRVRETALNRLVRRLCAREGVEGGPGGKGSATEEPVPAVSMAESPVSVDMSSIDMTAMLKAECRHSASYAHAIGDVGSQYDLFVDSYLSFN